MWTLDLDILAKLVHDERTNKDPWNFKDKVYSRKEDEAACFMIGQAW